jgi:flagellar basal-body rod modification protein FlgD
MSVSAVTANLAARTNEASSGTAGSSSIDNSVDGMDTTFLNLLITELKSQDPTAPMDATQMVGQMISLNQLDQLIGIHQLLQSATGTTTSNVNGGK